MANTVHHGSHRFAAPVDFDDEVIFGAAVEFAARASGMVDGIVFVDNLDRLPAAVNGARTLAADTCYYFTTAIDLLGTWLVLSSGTVLLGTSSETAILTSTGLDPGQAFVVAAHGGPNPMRHLRFEGLGTVFDIDGLNGANAALDWFAVNIVDCDTIGTIRDVGNLIVDNSAWLNSSGLTLDGTIETAAWEKTPWTVPSGSASTAITLPDTLVISRRFRLQTMPISVPSGCTGIAVADIDATFANSETLQITDVRFTGAGTYVTGATYSDDQVSVFRTVGVTNTAPVCSYSMTSNASATTITVQGTYYKIAGTPTAGTYNARFTVSGNRATYTGAYPRFFTVEGDVALTSGANNQIAVRVAVNGTTFASTTMPTTANAAGRAESLGVHGVVQLSPGDYIEIFVTNNSGNTAVTVTDLQVLIAGVTG